MPPKRRAAPATKPAPKQRRSALARTHNLTAAQETALREAFALFAIPHPSPGDAATPDAASMGVLPRGDARRALIALGIDMGPGATREMFEIVDPEGEGWVGWDGFVAYAAAVGMGGGEVDEEVRKAFGLFTKGAARRITVADLRRVARELREEVDEEVLWDMVVEANGERRTKEGVGSGVGLEEFEAVMRRAGVFG
ncbi:Ef-hand superfamily ca2+-modulated protein [Neofusicoccum parvum]|uniref:Ef-hand superfamily ca2+-modulated protein n=1 Tax=Neofusicoccum parvum TaxID=310453 RepID=A0ACB5S5W9_9PEZI|nr:Ef-hand superfamily ca2+-modulated protein [Neofusicoccum parvum]